MSDAEIYTEEELARAWAELDTVSVDWNRDRLARICEQVRKNRAYDESLGKLWRWATAQDPEPPEVPDNAAHVP